MSALNKILIIGASGSFGKVVTSTALARALDVTLFVRRKSRLGNSGNAKVIEGDATDLAAVEKAVKGQDVVYINLAGDLERMGRTIVKAMKNQGVKRVVAISSIGIYDDPVPSILHPYRGLADIIESSGLDYTILRPNWFTSANEIDYILTPKGQPERGTSISRKSIADFVVKIFENPSEYIGENLNIAKPN
ncbi:Isoflavone reductase, putative [Trichomonas vaginalis G3]|uniref:Isoflavone reductase, putative n=1 Tax=Trichomonas vaginalis (strain ATCC PRA-98 / G3) TaxID=412133 RepID=A2EJQ2_TRIV3|nr:NAD(P)H-binding [Trichomonas vaginalis G3]EAY07126.1 Isoflavone reductase, putative [Trichomonas vaginalis G3]KAI5522481.1 NAD(P)H-binding [Trichomonas vaginalis G3]|eukprot:XP_001319349.1 Isoflavone reductase [Trichomonas vaginalis G3]